MVFSSQNAELHRVTTLKCKNKQTTTTKIPYTVTMQNPFYFYNDLFMLTGLCLSGMGMELGHPLVS